MLEQHKLTDFTLKSLKSFKIQNALYLTMSNAHKSTGSRSLTSSPISRCIHDNYHSTNYSKKFFFYNLKNLFRKFPGVFSVKILFETTELRQRAYATLLFQFFYILCKQVIVRHALFEEYQASHFLKVRWQQRA